MARTIRPVIRKDKPNKDGTYPLAICFTIDRKRVYFNTGMKIPLQAWTGTEVKGIANFGIYNSKLKTMLADFDRQLLEKEINGEVITLSVIKSLFRKDTGRGDFYKSASEYLGTVNNPGTLRRYKHEFETLKAYSPNLSFADVTHVFLNKYKAHLTKRLDENTVPNSFKFIRRVFNYAKDHGQTTLYPFKDWKFPKYTPKPKPYLNLEQVESLWALLEKDELDDSTKAVVAFFCLECYSGIRYSDWRKYSVEKRVNGNNLYVRSTKTGVDVLLPLDLMPSLSKVVDYISAQSPKLPATGEHVNRLLKVAASVAGVKIRLTSHVGRHTCATTWLEKGMTREGVAALLGVSMKTVDTYAKFTTAKLRSEINRIGGI